MKFVRTFILMGLCLNLFCYTILSYGTSKEHSEKPSNEETLIAKKITFPNKLSETLHSIQLKGKILKYKSITGHLVMKDKSGESRASVFFVSYSKVNPKGDLTRRPVTFAFNGGPGSASLWLHMGALGPKRLQIPDQGLSIPPPYTYKDNPYTWLDFTDLVFIDPVSTGYSRPFPEVDKRKFHGVKEDIQSVGDFIRLYVTKYNRWLSPKFLCGESYGTTRAGGLSGYLQDRYGMYLTGLVLISNCLNWQNSIFAPGNDLPYIIYLPTYTATAWYHRKLAPKYQLDLKATLKEVEQWVVSDYLLALAKGDSLSSEERTEIIEKLSQYTGLSKAFIDKSDLRIKAVNFRRELLKDSKQIVGRLDTRLKAPYCNINLMGSQFDPSYSSIYGAFTAAINHYIRADLKYKCDLPYEGISGSVYPWNWGSAAYGYVNVTETIRQAMNKNKHLKIIAICGFYDLATPYFDIVYTLKKLGLPKELRKNVSIKYYESGHMMYTHKPSLKKLTKDVSEFYTPTVK